ncbi:MAG: tellurite resistance TerB family protein [Magnetococcales bacterium]|nr:tellurite resistance TerB family protein [Magnetococcales bacterium]
MSLAWLKENFEAAKQSLSKELTKFNNRSMMEAIVAGCAMVAYADGSVSSAEKQKMVGYLRTSDTMKVFDINEVIQLFQKYVEKFEFDHTIGHGEAMTVIGKFKGKAAEAQLIVRVCCAVGAADGSFDEKERKVVRGMCQELGLDPQTFDL